MPNNCCVCGAKIGKQYYQLSKNHPEEHLCPDCAEEIQSIYDLASSADPDFRRHMRRFSGKLEDGAASGAAIGYLEHFFQSCSRLYRDQLEQEARTGAETAAPETESDGSPAEPAVPEIEPAEEAEPENVPETDRQEEEDLQPPAGEASADPAPRIKRIGIRRVETIEEAAAGYAAEDPRIESSEPAAQEPERKPDPEPGSPEQEDAVSRPEEETDEDSERGYWPEMEESPRRKKGKDSHPEPHRKERIMPEDAEDEEETDSGNSGTGFLRVMAGVIPVACGAAGGLIGSFFGGDLVRTALGVLSGLAIGLSGTACMLAAAKCLDRIQELMDSIQNPRSGKKE